MNIIVNGYNSESINEGITKLFLDLDVKECIKIYSQKKLGFGNNIKTNFINWSDIIWNANYDIDWNTLLPLDEQIVEQMRDCEAVFLKMVDRLEGDKVYTYADRKRIYLKHLRYWNNIIDKNKIELFVSQNIPHETFDFVIYSLCKIKNIKTVLCYQSHVKDTVIIMNDWEKSNERIASLFFDLKKKYKTIDSNIPLSRRFAQYYDEQISDKAPAPFYMKKDLYALLKQFFSIFHKHKFPIFNKIFWRGIIIKIKTKYLFYFYEKNTDEPNLKQKYIYVPLHYQPELTTCPAAGVYVDQLLILQQLSYYLPKNVKIYVKEHPNQGIFCRGFDFYKDLLKINNLQLISRKYSSKKLINNLLAVATGIGTAGWEAFLHGKPVLMYGHDFYQYAPNVYAIKTNEDLKQALGSIEKCSKNSPLDIKLFLSALDQTSMHCYTDDYYKEITELSDEQNTTNLYQGMINYMKEH